MSLRLADAEFDLRFIDAMVSHEKGAVVMAKEASQKSKRPEIQELSIVKSQDKEISQMRQCRTIWHLKALSKPVTWHARMGHSMTMSSDQMQAPRMKMDLGQAAFGKRFLDGMIPHREGVVVIAQDVLKKSKCSETLQLAKEIIASQEAEIK